MLSAALNYIPRPELVSQAMKRMIVSIVTPESVLVLEDTVMAQTRVEMRLITHQTTETAHQGHGLHLGSVVGTRNFP